jgi:tetratricopeptide (TPR) repeat protein
MPQWTMEGAATLQLPSEAPKPIPKAPSFEIKTNKGIDEQLASRIQELAKERQAQGAPRPGLVIDQMRGRAGLVSDRAMPGLEARANRLEEARRLIEKKDYEGALQLIEQVLREFAAHDEALYLKGYCQFSLEQHEPALETLAPLRRVPSESDLGSQIRLLRGQIRDAITPQIVLETLALGAIGIAAASVPHLSRLVQLDPEGAIFHILLIRTLMVGGDLRQAGIAAEQAIPYCHGAEQAILEGLRGEIYRRDVEQKLEPARAYYREFKYRKARGVLERLRSSYGDRPLWITFNGYLQGLGGGFFSRPLMPAAVRPQGSTAEVEALHFFLVGPDLQQAKQLLRDESYQHAEIVLRAAHQFAPYFPYANFLLGVCIFKGLWAAIGGGNAPDIDSMFSLLSVAREFAEVGAQDPEIGEAPELVKAIDGTTQMFREIKAEIERQQREQKLMEPLFKDFVTLMESVKEGIRSPEHFREIQKKLSGIRERCPRVGPQIRTEQGRESFRQFEEVLQRNWEQLNHLLPDVEMAEKIGALRGDLEKALSGIAGGISSQDQFKKVEAALKGVQDKIRRFRQENKKLSKDATEAVDQIEGAVHQYMGQLDGIRGDIADAEVVNALMYEFNRLMSSVQGGISDYSQLSSFRSGMETLAKQVDWALEPGRVSRKAAQNLRELKTAITRVLDQVRGR